MKVSKIILVSVSTLWLTHSVAYALANGLLFETDVASPVSSIDWETVTPMPNKPHHHGVPILDQTLSPQQEKYWMAYNTTTYFTIQTPCKPQLWIHLSFLILSFAFIYPFVMIFNNLESNWYLPVLTVQAASTIVSVISYYIFISHAPNLFPNMAYSRMVTGLFVLTIIQYFSAIIYVAKRWIEGGPCCSADSHYLRVSQDEELVGTTGTTGVDGVINKNIHMSDLAFTSDRRSASPGNGSPSSTLYDRESFDIDDSTNLGSTIAAKENLSFYSKSKLAARRDSLLKKLFQYPVINKGVCLFGFAATIIFKILDFGMFAYFLVLLPTGVAGLNIMGRSNRVFNLLAHFIKGGVFFILGFVSLARYLGAFSRMGGAWNYACVTDVDKRHSLWLKMQPKGTMITFEMIESSLILLYGSTNIFLEHLAAAGEPWAAKDLQHISIAFMYIGAGLCGIITEVQLKDWRRSKFFDQVGSLIDSHTVSNVTPGFSPNPFPVFTIFWTGLLMSQHAQSSGLSTKVHVQWGSLLTYGSCFRILTFLLMSYYPLKDQHACFHPAKPFTELITSFCLLCGGLVFMESTDQVIEAMEYRGLTPMFTLNVSVGCIALLMAWIMVVFSFKNWLRQRLM
ncbi:hypothetical protein FOA43_004078 [Brettanomyces nanus]|uniref:Uncharacterized protein n=1 Tax=Eeniella nana TaxID=13502 RepID=A0A875SD79_EENNA|nr:uncharacterized protein FOA43_004078 [Brettanomyces nanus]QPG76684.1 hypothetical protein FOA43_004078 [Brettanomyces nanus]